MRIQLDKLRSPIFVHFSYRLTNEANSKCALIRRTLIMRLCICTPSQLNLMNFNVESNEYIWNDSERALNFWFLKCGYWRAMRCIYCHAEYRISTFSNGQILKNILIHFKLMNRAIFGLFTRLFGRGRNRCCKSRKIIQNLAKIAEIFTSQHGFVICIQWFQVTDLDNARRDRRF